MKGTVESTKPSMSPLVSILVPCLNEENTLRSLTERVEKTIAGLQNIQCELIFIDDGSTDETGSIIDQLSQEIPWVKAYHHSTTKGKSAAIMNGFYHSKGNIIILLDADLQFFPEDIPAILSEMTQKKLDIVNGWRKERKDPLSRRAASRLYNSFASSLFGLKVHDYNCGIKGIKREVLESFRLRKGYHRYILALAKHHGFRIGEVVVQHAPRPYGKSRYRTSRLFTGFVDLMSLKLQFMFMERPMSLFGVLGALIFLLGLISGVYLIYLWLLEGGIGTRPLLFLTVLLLVAGIQFFSFGFLADAIASLKTDVDYLNQLVIQKKEENTKDKED